MFLSKLKIVTAVLLTLGIVGAGVLTRHALADKPKPAADQPVKERKKEPVKGDGTELSAVVQSVDAAKQTITVNNNKGLASTTFDVSKEAKVLLDDGTGGKLSFKDGKLADLKEGMAVTLKLSADRKTVVAVLAEGATVHGTLKSADAGKHTITVSVMVRKGEPEQDKTFEVAKEASISIHGGKTKDKGTPEKTLTLADLPAGAVVTLRLSADAKVVSSIQAEGKDVHGTVKAVDAEKKTITVTVKDGEQTFSILPNASIVIGAVKDKGKRGSDESRLADLPVGAIVSLKLSPDQKSVVSISADGPSFSGTVKAVDAGQGRLTLTVAATRKGEPGEEKSFAVAKDAAVRIDGKESKLADLPVSAVVSVRLSLDQKNVVSVLAEGHKEQGVVKAVDAGVGSVTLARKSGEQTFTVPKEAEILIDGKPGKLVDVPVDSVANARLTADQRTVLSLSAAGPSLQGVLKSLDAGKRTVVVTVAVRKGETEEKTFTLAETAQVVTAINGVALKFADLKLGKEIALLMSADQKTVLRITVLAE